MLFSPFPPHYLITLHSMLSTPTSSSLTTLSFDVLLANAVSPSYTIPARESITPSVIIIIIIVIINGELRSGALMR